MISNFSARHYQKSKESLEKKLAKGIKIFLKKKKQKYSFKKYKNLPEREKERLGEYRKNYYKTWKNASQ